MLLSSLLTRGPTCRLPRLLELDLSGNVLTGFSKLIKSPLGKGLRILNLEEARAIGVAGFRAMLGKNALPRLCEVRLEGTDHDIEFVYEELAGRFGDRIEF